MSIRRKIQRNFGRLAYLSDTLPTGRRRVWKLMVSFIPFLEWIRKYRWRRSLFADLSSGLTMAILSIPTGIAHAEICGVAPVYGLYTAMFPTFFYLFFGYSRHNALGAFAILSLMTRAAVEKVRRIMISLEPNFHFPTNIPSNISILDIAEPGYASGPVVSAPTDTSSYIKETLEFFNESLLNEGLNLSITFTNASKLIWNDEKIGNLTSIRNEWPEKTRPIHVATIIVFLSGAFQILMGIFRLDFLSCYLSEQVLGGFILGGCVHVLFSQIGDVLGIQLPPRSGRAGLALYQRIFDIYTRIYEVKLPSVIISLCSIGFLLFSQFVLDPWLKGVFYLPIPFELILTIIGITATNFADLSNRYTVKVVGNIPTGFPPPELPRFDLISLIFFDALGIAVTAIAIHLAVVKVVEHRYNYKINNCKELYSLGFSNICASPFPVIPVTSIFANTIIGEANKNCTPLSTCFSFLALLSIILYIGPAFEFLPKCILSSIIIVTSLTSFTKFKEMLTLWPLFKVDFVIFLVSFALVVCYDIWQGLASAIIFAFMTVIIRDQWPKWHFLSHDEESRAFKEVPKKKLHTLEGNACILRYDAPLVFTNVSNFIKATNQSLKIWNRREIDMPFVRDFSAECDKTRLEQVTLIIDCSGFSYTDYSGLQTLKKIYCELSEQMITVKFAAPKTSLLGTFEKTDFFIAVPRKNVFPTVSSALKSNIHPPK